MRYHRRRNPGSDPVHGDTILPVDHELDHPDIHRPWAEWSEEQTLHVAAAYSNPFRWRTRRELFNDFRRHMQATDNVKLHVGELAYGDRPYEVTDDGCRRDIQFRGSHELFHKENILNQTIVRSFPADWKYGAYVDGDFTFTRHDWALEAIHLLQHYDFVQLFSSYSDLSSGVGYGGERPLGVRPSFAAGYVARGCQLPDGYDGGGWKTAVPYSAPPGAKGGFVGATGGAWAWRRSAFETVGGLLDVCILGHGDWFMAFGLVGEPTPDMHIDRYTSGYQGDIFQWQRRAAKLQRNIGCVDQFAVHHWHGSKTRRGYSTRDQLLVQHQFDSRADIHRDYQGIWQLTDDKPKFRDAVRLYFMSRTEDNPNLGDGEREMV